MKRRALLACAAIAALWTAAVLAQAADPTALATLKSPERERTLAEGARREGEVSVYTSIVPEDMAVIAAAFEKRYGVKAKYWRASSEKVLQRSITEARSGRYDVDVVETNGPELEALHREKVLAAASSAHDADLVPAALQPHREWVGLRLNLF